MLAVARTRPHLLILAFGLAFSGALLPLGSTVAFAATVNINTADAATLDALPGIGSTKAQAIVAYRDANGPFATIADIQKVSGIGASTFANIESFITVGSPETFPVAIAVSNDTAVSASPAVVPAPASTIVVTLSGETRALTEVPARFSAIVKTKSGSVISNSQLVWSFGDGSAEQGSSVTKTFHYPGIYVVSVVATDGSAQAEDESVVSVEKALVRVSVVNGDGITLTNDSSNELDLSGWWLRTDGGFFRIPTGMRILPASSALFPWSILRLPITFGAALSYPDGILATRFSPPVAQPSAPVRSSKEVKVVESSPIANISSSAYENTAVSAPRVSAIVPDARGAAVTATSVPSTSALSADAAAAVLPGIPVSELLHSGWTFGFLGVLAVAGGAFLIL